MHIVEAWGTGIPRVITSCKQYGLQEPVFEEFGDGIKATVYRLQATKASDKRQKQATSDKNKRQAEKISGKDKTAENKEVIVAYITAQGNAKTSEIAEHIGLSQPRVRAILSELVSKGIVEAEGESRARYYKIR
jgi:predicted HTH transcriptional regulator